MVAGLQIDGVTTAGILCVSAPSNIAAIERSRARLPMTQVRWGSSVAQFVAGLAARRLSNR